MVSMVSMVFGDLSRAGRFPDVPKNLADLADHAANAMLASFDFLPRNSPVSTKCGFRRTSRNTCSFLGRPSRHHKTGRRCSTNSPTYWRTGSWNKTRRTSSQSASRANSGGSRLASPLSGQEHTGRADGGLIQVELSAALNKVGDQPALPPERTA
jgi:hypothetical protein